MRIEETGWDRTGFKKDDERGKVEKKRLKEGGCIRSKMETSNIEEARRKY
jgi:hypothetical protein